jgi:hypothetical protein
LPCTECFAFQNNRQFEKERELRERKEKQQQSIQVEVVDISIPEIIQVVPSQAAKASATESLLPRLSDINEGHGNNTLDIEDGSENRKRKIQEVMADPSCDKQMVTEAHGNTIQVDIEKDRGELEEKSQKNNVGSNKSTNKTNNSIKFVSYVCDCDRKESDCCFDPKAKYVSEDFMHCLSTISKKPGGCGNRILKVCYDVLPGDIPICKTCVNCIVKVPNQVAISSSSSTSNSQPEVSATSSQGSGNIPNMVKLKQPIRNVNSFAKQNSLSTNETDYDIVQKFRCGGNLPEVTIDGEIRKFQRLVFPQIVNLKIPKNAWMYVERLHPSKMCYPFEDLYYYAHINAYVTESNAVVLGSAYKNTQSKVIAIVAGIWVSVWDASPRIHLVLVKHVPPNNPEDSDDSDIAVMRDFYSKPSMPPETVDELKFFNNWKPLPNHNYNKKQLMDQMVAYLNAEGYVYTHVLGVKQSFKFFEERYDEELPEAAGFIGNDPMLVDSRGQVIGSDGMFDVPNRKAMPVNRYTPPH